MSYYEVDIRLKVNWCDDEEHAKRRVEPIMDDLKKYEDASFVFIENPRIVNVVKVMEHSCLDCVYCFYEFVGGTNIDGDECTRLVHGCKRSGDEVTPYFENDCEYWRCKE